MCYKSGSHFSHISYTYVQHWDQVLQMMDLPLAKSTALLRLSPYNCSSIFHLILSIFLYCSKMPILLQVGFTLWPHPLYMPKPGTRCFGRWTPTWLSHQGSLERFLPICSQYFSSFGLFSCVFQRFQTGS